MIRPGQPISARTINELARRAEGRARLRVGSPLGQKDLPAAPNLWDQTERRFHARLSGVTSPYGLTEVYGTAGGGWSTLAGGRSCSGCAYEWNAESGLNQKVVEIGQDEASLYRFLFRRQGGQHCTPIICVTVTGCGSVQRGALVTVKQGATVIGTCTTDASGSCCVAVPTPGSYDVVVSKSCFITKTAMVTATCATLAITVNLTIAAGCHCQSDCCPNPLPNVFFVTFRGKTVACTYQTGGAYFNSWLGCEVYSSPNATDGPAPYFQPADCGCVGHPGPDPPYDSPAHATTADCPIVFVLGCLGPPGSGQWSLTATWYGCTQGIFPGLLVLPISCADAIASPVGCAVFSGGGFATLGCDPVAGDVLLNDCNLGGLHFFFGLPGCGDMTATVSA